MNIYSVIQLLGGLAFFLYGMSTLSSSLERLAGGKLEGMMKRVTSSKVKGVLFGTGVTMAIQSSSAVTVMLVGLVNSGIIAMSQSVSIIMGSNIGTTLTTWIISLIGIESDILWLNLLKPKNFSPIFALIGILTVMISKRHRNKNIGTALVSFAVLMSGMEFMSDAVSPLADSPEFMQILTKFTNPFLCLAAGAIFTALIQSSSASVGILEALALTGGISYSMAVPIIMGQNIGTCITVLISSIGVSKNAKKVGVVHLLFNLFGTAVFFVLLKIIDLIFVLDFKNAPITPLGIAVVHSAFNVSVTLILLPLSRWLEKAADFIVRDKKKSDGNSLLDERLLATPSVAAAECDAVSAKVGRLAHKTALDALECIFKFDERTAAKVKQNEISLDEYEDALGAYLIKVSKNALSGADSKRVSKILHVISDFERLGDHAVNIVETVELYGAVLDDEARKSLADLRAAMSEILELTFKAYETSSLSLAKSVEPLEQVIDVLISDIKSEHIRRLQSQKSTARAGVVLGDLLNNLERIGDHCSNIAVAVIGVRSGNFNSHKYLNSVRYGDKEFAQKYEIFSKKYGA